MVTQANINRLEDSMRVTPHRGRFSTLASQHLSAWIYCAGRTTKCVKQNMITLQVVQVNIYFMIKENADLVIRELKQTRRRREREGRLKM